jgi:glycosyltransferase involved in cell wall biosynthesis
MPETYISVILCTHNPRPDYLQRTLASLKAQTLPKAQWELLLVDNASQQPVAPLYDLTWHPQGRHIHEKTLGLTPARLCSIKAANGQWLVFVDDDNVVAEDYLTNSMLLVKRYPQLVVFGAGTLQPEFEIVPPAELKNLLFMLALRDTDTPRWSNNPKDSTCLPFGAGLCVQQKIAEEYAALIERLKINQVLDRRGTQLYSHGDDLFSWTAAETGYGFGIFPELRITHLIAAGRLNRKYFLKLIYFSAFSHCMLHFLLAGEMPEKIKIFRLLRLFPHALRRGNFSVRCQWGWLKGEDRAARFILKNQLSPKSKCAKQSDP